MAHPLGSTAGSTTWRAGRRSITFCQSRHWSAQQFGGRALSKHGRESRAPPAQEEWGNPKGAKPPWRLFGDFLAVQKVTGVWGAEPQGLDEEGIHSEESSLYSMHLEIFLENPLTNEMVCIIVLIT